MSNCRAMRPDSSRPVARPWLAAGGASVLAAALCLVGAGPAGAASATVGSASDLQAKMADNATDVVQLSADISISDGSNVAVSTALAKTLDLAGHTLSISSVSTNQAALNVPGGANLTITGGGSLTATGGASGAGIGGGNAQGAGAVAVQSGTVVANGGSDAAGIGGGSGGNGGTLNVFGGDVTASGGSNGAGVGGGKNGSGGTVATSGIAKPTSNELHATGGPGGAGIGGGLAGSGGTLNLSGGGVDAHGGSNGAGVGGGDGGASGGTVNASSGSLFAAGGASGAGVGGGRNGSGSALMIGAAGAVTATDGGGTSSAVGQGAGGSGFGSVTNSGGLVIDTGATVRIPSGASFQNSNTVFNKGTITAAATAGTLQNDGTILNTGTIQNNGEGGSGNVTVANHSYRLDFDVNGGPSATPGSQHVFAQTMLTGNVALPTVSPPSGGIFLGWYTAASGGSQVTTSTDLSGLLGAGPAHATLFAHYRLPQTINFPIIGDQTFGAPDFSLTATASSGLSVTYSASPTAICTVSGSTVHLVAAGSCTVFAAQGGNADFLPATSVGRTFQVKNGVVTVTATGFQTYGAQPSFVPTGSLPSGVSLAGTLSCTGLSGGGGIKPSLAPANYTIDPLTCGGISLSGPNASNYTMVFGGGTFAVAKATVVVTATGSQEYQGAATFTPVVTTPPNVTLAGTLSCVRLTGSTPIDPNLAVGSYIIDSTTCSGLTLTGAESPGYQLAYADGGYTVKGKPITVTATGTEGFGGSPTFTPQATLPSGVTLTGTLTCTKLTGNVPISGSTLGVTTYTIDATSCSGLSLSGAAASNYRIVYANGPFTVTKAHVAISSHTNSTANASQVHKYIFTSTVTNTDANSPVANIKVTITVKLGLYTSTCAATTNASGVATCTSGDGNLFLNPGHAFTAATPATANLLAGAGSGTLGS
jgi:hypothetical protein